VSALDEDTFEGFRQWFLNGLAIDRATQEMIDRDFNESMSAYFEVSRDQHQAFAKQMLQEWGIDCTDPQFPRVILWAARVLRTLITMMIRAQAMSPPLGDPLTLDLLDAMIRSFLADFEAEIEAVGCAE
jgi:hypothetical protein